MTTKTALTALALAASTLTASVLSVQAAGFRLPPQLRYVGGVGHAPTALPKPPRCDKPKLPLPGCRTPLA